MNIAKTLAVTAVAGILMSGAVACGGAAPAVPDPNAPAAGAGGKSSCSAGGAAAPASSGKSSCSAGGGAAPAAPKY
ncbi:MAG TPA: hypothetical protein VMI75_11875 [Polyangiaceae bacterium]|nr:hypothetical protein [Polyangiaceae bacterium]